MTENGSPADANAAEPVEQFPAKLRVHALARALGLTSRKVLEHLAELGHEARSPQSSIDRTAANAVRDRLTDGADVEGAGDEGADDQDTQADLGLDAQPALNLGPELEPEPNLFSAASGERHDPIAPRSQPSVAFTSAPLFLPPEPQKYSPAPKPDSDEKAEPASTDGSDADAARVPHSPQGTGAEHDEHDDSADDESGENGRNRRRRRGRRGRGRGRGEQSGDADVSTSQAESADAKQAGDGAASESENVSDATGKAGASDSDAAAERVTVAEDGQKTENSKKAENSKKNAENSKTESAQKSGDQKSAERPDDAAATDEKDAGEDGPDDESAEDDDATTEPTSKRRRRRRRRKGGGEGDESSPDDPPNTVVHEREPRSKRARDEVQGISGSTRLEAKRQRRRDGRDAGRRRPPILSESEFLARREAVDRVMVVRERGPLGADHPGDAEDYTQVAVLEDGVLVEHFVTTETSASMVGNIYLGRVQNVLPGMEAAFVDIGRGRNGVLYAGEVNWDAAGLDGGSRKIEQALKPGDNVLVQVSKDPVGHKGARLTTQISLAGRYLVYVPGGSSTGISRKLPDTERKRLRSILGKLVPDDAGVIIRTASEGVSAEELGADIERLESQWQKISSAVSDAQAQKSSAPKSLYEEPDLLVRVVRDLFNEDFRRLVVEGPKAWNLVERYISDVAPDLMERVEKFEKRNADSPDSFVVHRVDEQLAKALDRKVWLPSGGTLIIEHTEAMTVIDVNTGKFTGSGGNLEETVTRNNLEAAEEIVRQMRLRDIGGMIIVDFIDMVLESNRDLVLRRLTEALARDRTRHQVSEVTSLGLVQMTRKRLGTGLLEAFSTTCSTCAGRGVIVHANPVEVRGGEDNGSKGDGSSKRSRRRGRKNDQQQSDSDSGRSGNNDAGQNGSGQSGDGDPEVKHDDKHGAHHAAGDHPMFRAMAAHAHDHDDDVLADAGTATEPVAADSATAAPALEDPRDEAHEAVADLSDAQMKGRQATAAAGEDAAAAVEPDTQPSTRPTSGAQAPDAGAVDAEASDAGRPATKTSGTQTSGTQTSEPQTSEPQPPARQRRRRAARRAAASTGTSTTIVIGADDAGSASHETAASTPVTTSGSAGEGSTPSAPVARRPRRRAAGRPAGPPVE